MTRSADVERAAWVAGVGYPWGHVTPAKANFAMAVSAAAEFVLGEGGVKPALYLATLLRDFDSTLTDQVVRGVWKSLSKEAKVGLLYMLFAAGRHALLKQLSKSVDLPKLTSRSVARSLRQRHDLAFFEMTGSKLPPVDPDVLAHVEYTSLPKTALASLLRASLVHG